MRVIPGIFLNQNQTQMPKSKKEEVLDNLWDSLKRLTIELCDPTHLPDELKKYSKTAERVVDMIWDIMNLPKS